MSGEPLRRIGAISHVRLSVFPDGGVARLRVWGELAAETMPAVIRLNALPVAKAIAALRGCCGAARWAERMAAARPFEDAAALVRIGERHLWQLDEADWLDAFAAHPRIGDQTGASPAAGAAWASDEQRAVASAESETLAALAAANQAYLDRFGFLFIVCATGRTAEAMLADLRQRLDATRVQELRTAAEEQAKITQLRLRKLIQEMS